jgi:hypothetical protein
MHTDNVFDIRSQGRQTDAIECTIGIKFYKEKISYSISGVEVSLSDRLAIAAALEATANDLRGRAKGLELFGKE